MARLADDKVQRIVTLRQAGKSYREIGEEVGVNQSTALRVCRRYARAHGALDAETGKGPPTDPVNVPIDDRDGSGETRIVTPDRPRTLDEMAELFGVDRTKWVAQVVRTNEWQGFYKVRDGDTHRKVSLWQTRVVWRRILTEHVESAILQFARENVPAIPAIERRPPQPSADSQMVAWGLWDAHLGMYAWGEETGESYDVDIATRRVFNSIDDMVEELRTYNVSRVVMPVGNDFLHFDSVRMKTTHGEHFLDTDTRYGRVYLAALRCLAYMVERAGSIAPRVDVLYVPGNHDVTSSFTLVACLQERYRGWDRVRFDLRMCPRKSVRHGGTLLGFDHGQKASAQQLALTFPQWADDYAGATYREVQVGHTHQRREQMFQTLVPTNGVIVRTNPALCNVDAWHTDRALTGEPVKSVEAYRYDETGFRGSHVTWARDDDNPNEKEFAL